MNTVTGYISAAFVLINIGLAAFVAAAPANTLAWWVTAGVLAFNAVVHALPSAGISVVAPPPAPKA